MSRNFVVTHQWLRELRRSHQGPLAGVYFRVPDDELVFVAAGDALGLECVVPRRIEANEIHRCRRLPQGIGWRYFPGAHGKRPSCVCDFCIRGKFGARKLPARFGSGNG
ncbi:MAG: hypothetical protein JNK15_22775 [Planctomycetes bacterium]|nr:hypothetical protein [Planctomycetota bacterium]